MNSHTEVGPGPHPEDPHTPAPAAEGSGTGTPAPAPARARRRPAPDSPAARRRRRRLRITLATLPLSLVAALLVVKLLSMYGLAHAAILNVAAANYEASTAASRWLQPLNFFERYKAPFNLGVGLASEGRAAEARELFEEALPLAHDMEVCGIRVNLAIVIEMQGDEARAAGDLPTSLLYFREAATVVQETPAECRSEESDKSSSDPRRSLGDALDELERDLNDKIQEGEGTPPEQPDPGEGDQPSGGGEGEQEQPQGPSPEQLDLLDQQLKQGERERQSGGPNGPGGGGGTDRPW